MPRDPLADIIAQAKALASTDKALAYHYLIAVLESANQPKG